MAACRNCRSEFLPGSSGACSSRWPGPTPRCPSRGATAPSSAELALAFRALHERHFGFRVAVDAALVVESLELEAVVPGPDDTAARAASASSERAKPIARRNVWCGDGWRNVPVYDRARLPAGTRFTGPALIAEANATTIVEPGWRAEVHATGTLLLTRTGRRVRREALGRDADPIMLEVFNNLFMHVAEEMGIVLEHTAHSVNIKERLDFSCALFAADGALIANAPHIPVHLGSMGDSVQSILRSKKLAPGDAYLLNSPYNGGTHLPDLTVVTPVFDERGREAALLRREPRAPRRYRRQHAGLDAARKPHDRRRRRAVRRRAASSRAASCSKREVRALLARGPFPARNPDQNIADLKAQLAANARGVAELERLIAAVRRPHRRRATCGTFSTTPRRACARRSPRCATAASRSSSTAASASASPSPSAPTAARATVDFSGTSPASAGNFNAPSSIVRAAVLYVFRTLVRQNIPLNAGCLEPLTIVLPEGGLLDPRYPAAVVAGNVETSQCITDALLAALDACAGSQGTMNNFTFGNARHQYYETLCGGAGAGPGFDGASAVHTHMTNSRLTDPEVLEQRYPVRIVRFAIRRGSGGAGRWRGGDGVVREVEFLEPMQAAILSNRRRVAPHGLAGGSPGACGRNYVLRRDGRVEELGGDGRRRARGRRPVRHRDAGRRRLRRGLTQRRNHDEAPRFALASDLWRRASLEAMSKPLKRGATYADLYAVPDNFVAEIIAGELYATPRPAVPHAHAASVLGIELGGPFHRGRNGPAAGCCSTSPSCISAKTCSCRISRGGAASGCRRCLPPRTSRSHPIGCARCCRRAQRRSIGSRSLRSTHAKVSATYGSWIRCSKRWRFYVSSRSAGL